MAVPPPQSSRFKQQPPLPAILITPHTEDIFHTAIVTSTTNASSLLSANHDWSRLNASSIDGANGNVVQRTLKWELKSPFLAERVGGRSSKQKRGWGNLPINILHIILTHTQDETELDTVLHHSYGSSNKTHDIAKAIVDRVWFCRMRFVSPGWKSAVDSHPFWPSYTLTLDPSRLHHSTVTDYHSSRLTPSTPSFATLFHRSRATTLSTCLACRLNHPSRLGLYPAVRKRLTKTSKFGWAPTCDKHFNHYCINCLREDNTPSPRHSSKEVISPQARASRLLPASWSDTDEHGRLYSDEGNVCAECRHFSLDREIQLGLQQCARGGPVRGTQSKWSRSVAYSNYVMEGQDTAVEAARLVLEEQWLTDQTRYEELVPTALDLQKYTRSLKSRYIKTGYREDERDQQHRHDLITDIRGEDMGEQDIYDDEEEMAELYLAWGDIAKARKARAKYWADYEDGVGPLPVEDEDDDDGDLTTLDEEHEKKLEDGCINDWLNDRMRSGFWVSPADEVRQLTAQTNITPMLDIASKVLNPDPSLTPAARLAAPAEAVYAYHHREGLINLRVTLHPQGGIASDPFLPPHSLLHKLDSAYWSKLSSRLRDPFTQMADYLEQIYPDDEPRNEKRTEVAESLNVRDLLLWLRRPEIWVKGRLAWAAHDERSLKNRLDGVDLESDAGGDTVHSSEEEEEEVVESSPRVEVVDEGLDEFDVDDFNIREVRSSEDETDVAGSTVDRGNPSTAVWAQSSQVTLDDLFDSHRRESYLNSGTTSKSSSPALGKRKATEELLIEREISPKRQAVESLVDGDSVLNGSSKNKEESTSHSDSDSRSETVPITPEDPESHAGGLEAVEGDEVLVREDIDGAVVNGLATKTSTLNQAKNSRTSTSSPPIFPRMYDPATALDTYPTPIPNDPTQLHVTEIPLHAYQAGYRHLLLPSSGSSPSDSLQCPSASQLINPILSRPVRFIPPRIPYNIQAYMHTPSSLIPSVPLPTHELGKATEGIMKEAWEESWAAWKECLCTVCERAKVKWHTDNGIVYRGADAWEPSRRRAK